MSEIRVIPGIPLSISGNVILGEGLYTLNGQVYASRVGLLQTTNSEESLSLVASVVPTPPSVPAIGQTIIGTVTRLTSRYIGIDITVIDEPTKAIYYHEPFKGTLRSQDIWPSEEKDTSTQLYMSFRPGDLVRARIIGVGDTSSGFLLSTAVEDSLGVVFAKCASSGEPLVPISWNEMICPKTGTKESRKPARPRSGA